MSMAEIIVAALFIGMWFVFGIMSVQDIYRRK